MFESHIIVDHLFCSVQSQAYGSRISVGSFTPNPLKIGQLREEDRNVGMWAQPTHPHIPLLAPRGWLFSALIRRSSNR